MKKVGIVGLGDMGIGMARNLLKNGFDLTGFDIKEDRMNEFVKSGGKRAVNGKEVGADSDAVFVMVLNGQQVKEAVLGENGLLEGLKPGAKQFQYFYLVSKEGEKKCNYCVWIEEDALPIFDQSKDYNAVVSSQTTEPAISQRNVA